MRKSFARNKTAEDCKYFTTPDAPPKAHIEQQEPRIENVSQPDKNATNKGATKVTIADTLYDAANDIRGYIEDDMVPSDKLEDELMGVVAMMDALRGKIDALGNRKVVAPESKKLEMFPENANNYNNIKLNGFLRAKIAKMPA
jgi:hypothetical protein